MSSENPATDYVPLLALLPRRLSDAEVVQLVEKLVGCAKLPVEATDIRVMINKITDQIASPHEVERVNDRLAIHGWTTLDEFPSVRGQ
jgi:hypothetical protein